MVTTVNISKVNPLAEIPEYETADAAGFDLRSMEDVVINPKETVLVSTGLAVALPKGTELQVRPRSGMSLKTKLRVANSPGTIDADYRGEIKIIMENTGDKPINVERNQRVAQGVLAPVLRANFNEVTDLDETERGEGGFGSTGE